MKTAWEIYNGYINDRRQGGATLQEIANDIGITRERVRQILVEQYGTAKVTGFLSTMNVVKQVDGLNLWRLNQLVKLGVVKPVRAGKKRFWDAGTVSVLRKYFLDRKCRICGNLLPISRSVYCCDSCYDVGIKELHKRVSWRKLRRMFGQKFSPSIDYIRRPKDGS